VSLVLEARQVSKRFLLRHNSAGELKVRLLGLLDVSRRQRVEEFWAIKTISLRIRQGESLAMIGRNGSGKSTFLKLVAGIHRPTGGQLLVARGTRIGSMIELGTGFHPELTGQENVLLNASIHGIERAEAFAMYDAIVAYSGLQHFMDVPLKNYSSGMHMRLGFAIAANLDPDVLLLDEIFAVGDDDFQKQCMGTLRSFQDRGKTIIFVSHSTMAIQAICHRGCVLDNGRLIFDGPVDASLTEYRRLTSSHPNEAVRAEESAAAIEAGRDRDADPELSWHRLMAGGLWTAEGDWVYDFVRRQGLRPDQYLLEVGCGSLSAARHLLTYMEQSHYWGFEKDIELFIAGSRIELPRVGVRAERGHFIVNDDFDLSEAPLVDMAVASSLLRRLPLNAVARCVASVVRRLGPGGRFYATWSDNPDPQSFEPIERPDGAKTYSDRDPFHYSFPVLAAVIESAGGRVEQLDDDSHPRGERVLVITRAGDRP
jgi:ABC-type polysaccharide/polyol phosphate transport system ATPase subunit/SAM-dependent methyltransferase